MGKAVAKGTKEERQHPVLAAAAGGVLHGAIIDRPADASDGTQQPVEAGLAHGLVHQRGLLLRLPRRNRLGLGNIARGHDGRRDVRDNRGIGCRQGFDVEEYECHVHAGRLPGPSPVQ